mmetsp:Transcript_101260/g.201198  ORF Transcript_101260/g.201198 Transcript_101260/m.201198 type:complete len:542 (+) Transcript_101260:96-1721(+)
MLSPFSAECRLGRWTCDARCGLEDDGTVELHVLRTPRQKLTCPSETAASGLVILPSSSSTGSACPSARTTEGASEESGILMQADLDAGNGAAETAEAAEDPCAHGPVSTAPATQKFVELHPCEWCGACVACDCRLGIEQWLDGNANLHHDVPAPVAEASEASADAAADAAATTSRQAIEGSLLAAEAPVSTQKAVVFPSNADGTGITILEKVRQHSQDFALNAEWGKLANGSPHQAAPIIRCQGSLRNDKACGPPRSAKFTTYDRGSLDDGDSESTRSVASPDKCQGALDDEASPSSDVGAGKFDAESKPQELATHRRIAGSNAAPQSTCRSRADWWREAHIPSIRSLAGYISVGNLLDVRVERHSQSHSLTGPAAPWHPKSSAALYEQMGMRDRQKTYITAWLNMGGASLVSLAEVTNPDLLHECVTSEDFLMRRLKLVPGLMQGKFSLPSVGPDMAETVGSFFGLKNVDCFHTDDSAAGPAHVCIRVDLYSKWYVRMGMQAGCFRIGNVAELLLVDVVSNVVMAGCRLIITPDFLALMK